MCTRGLGVFLCAPSSSPPISHVTLHVLVLVSFVTLPINVGPSALGAECGSAQDPLPTPNRDLQGDALHTLIVLLLVSSHRLLFSSSPPKPQRNKRAEP